MIGREKELHILNEDYDSSKSSIIVCYGRRRIGKSFLLHHYLQNKPAFSFEGIEAQSSSIQIQSFVKQVLEVFKLPTTTKRIQNWEDALTFLTEQIKKRKKKTVIFFDEFQWMTSGKSYLPALLKKFWDNDWRKLKIQLILCGSVSSFMINKVIKSKALYGRIHFELKIDFLSAKESLAFFKSTKSKEEVLKYLITFGGVPKYLVDLKHKLSYEENISALFFDKNSSYIDEFQKIFYSQFKGHRVYESIIISLSEHAKNLDSISKDVKMKSGGGLRSYLKNLEMAQFIKSYSTSPLIPNSKLTYYRLTDPFLRFYFTFVYPNKELILNSRDPLQLTKRLTQNKFNSFMGLAFENYCFVNAIEIAEKLKIENKLIAYGPLFLKNILQIDILYFRDDKILHLVEVKFSQEEIPPSIIVEIEKKVDGLKNLYPEYSIQKNLLTISRPSKKLLLSGYFDQIIHFENWPLNIK